MTNVWKIASVFLLTLAGGCGGEFASNESCEQTPSMCASGQTCWLNHAATGWECLNAGSGAEGDGCQLSAGTPTCGHGLICYAVRDGPPATCTPACSPTDPAATCPQGRQCIPLLVSGLRFHACEP